MLVMEALADILKKEGVSTLFCYPTTPIIEAAAAVGIRPVLCRQERVGVDMAHGYARVTNGDSIGVFAMQYGPGVENAFAGIASAYSDSVPLLLLPLAHSRSVSQVFPLFRASNSLRSVTKSLEELTVPHEVGNVMRRAFNSLRNGRLGPTMVEFPLDVVQHELGSEILEYRPVPRTIFGPNDADIDAAARLLLEAECPMIQAGQGVLYAKATEPLRELAELLEIPVTTSVDGKSAFPENHPLSLGTAGPTKTADCRHFLEHSDVVFGIGTSFTRHALTNPILPANKRLIHATIDARDLHKGYELEVAILGDARLVLERLIEAVRDRMGARRPGQDTRRKIATLRQAWLEQWKRKLDSDETPMTPYRVMAEFGKQVNPDNAIVTHDSGSPRDQLLPFYSATTPNSYIGWGKSHQLGTGLGLAIGAKLAKPDKLCVNFMGDAAFGMTGLDFETAVRVDAPIMTIVLNNATMAIETKAMALSHARYRTRDIGGRYADVARDLGGWSERVEDASQIRGAIQRAERATLEGRPALLEFATSSETEFSYRIGLAH